MQIVAIKSCVVISVLKLQFGEYKRNL